MPNSLRPVPTAAACLIVAGLVGAAVLVSSGVWPAWTGCPALIALLGGVWWIASRADRVAAAERAVPEPTPEQQAERQAAREAADAEWAAQTAEHARVEAVLSSLLRRAGIRAQYLPPLGGHMDKREGTYVLDTPLPVAAADLAALNGPLTRFEATTAPDGSVALTFLSARDRQGGGIEATVRRTPGREP